MATTTPRTYGQGQYKRRKRIGRFRSNSELKTSQQLNDYGAKWKYEVLKFVYYTPSKNTVVCENCGPVKALIERYYLHDFFLSNGVILEVKGRLVAADRAKMQAMKKYHPDLDLRMVFDYDRKYNSKGDRYSDWAEKAGIPWCIKTIPEEWLLHSDQAFPRKWKAMLFPGSKEVPVPKKKKLSRGKKDE